MKTVKVMTALALAAAVALGAGCGPRVGLNYAFGIKQPEGYVVHPNAGFNTGDRFRIHIYPDQDCFVYVLHEGTDGTYHMLFPLGAVEGGANYVKAKHEVQIPSTGNLALDTRPGIERLYLLASLEPLRDLDNLRGREDNIHPDEFKLALKNVDMAYTIHGRRNSLLVDRYTHEVIKGSPVLNVNIDITHQ